MRAEEFVTEIERIPKRDYTGGKDQLDTYDPRYDRDLKSLPGGSGLKYNVRNMGRWGLNISIFDTSSGEPEIVGQLNLEQTNNFPMKDSHQVNSITVDEAHRGKGIAKALYGIYLSILKMPLIAGSMQTPGGRKNWVSLSSIPGVEVMGYVSVNDRDFDFPDNAAAFNRFLTSIMNAGAEYLGSTGSGIGKLRWFLFPVVPGATEMQPAVKKTLALYTGPDGYTNTGLVARWTGQ